jgi:hypothetical protein
MNQYYGPGGVVGGGSGTTECVKQANLYLKAHQRNIIIISNIEPALILEIMCHNVKTAVTFV